MRRLLEFAPEGNGDLDSRDAGSGKVEERGRDMDNGQWRRRMKIKQHECRPINRMVDGGWVRRAHFYIAQRGRRGRRILTTLWIVRFDLTMRDNADYRFQFPRHVDGIGGKREEEKSQQAAVSRSNVRAEKGNKKENAIRLSTQRFQQPPHTAGSKEKAPSAQNPPSYTGCPRWGSGTCGAEKLIESYAGGGIS